MRSFVFLFACVCYSFKSFEQIFMKMYVNMTWPKEEVVYFYERCRSYSGLTLITNFQRSEFKCVFSITLSFWLTIAKIMILSSCNIYVGRVRSKEEVVTF